MLIESIQTALTAQIWWSYLLRIVLFYLLAWLIHKLSDMRFGRVRRLLRPRDADPKIDRVETTRRLISSFVTIVAFAVATIFSLALFVPAETIVWVIGLFAGGFGIALMPLLRDMFTGITFLFEDTFDVGEKVELLTAGSIEGVVEHVNLRTTSIRARSGELFVVPNGEIRVVRNFSRGHFSTADVTISIDSAELTPALNRLEAIKANAMLELPELLEPLKVISESGHINQRVELKLVAKARYGKAADLRPRLLAYVHEQLRDVEIELGR